MSYMYSKLPDPSGNVRLLVLESGALDDALHGRLILRNRSSLGNTSFEAVSYVWGNPTRCEDFVIRNGAESAPIRITANLHKALRRFRKPDQERVLWIDQLCINQEDEIERSHQVQLMGSIYRQAAHVLVWLGPDDEDKAQPALKVVHDLYATFEDKSRRRKFHLEATLGLDGQTKEPWTPFHDLTCLPWFRRCWIVQEIGYRHTATLYWGEIEFEWAMLIQVCSHLRQYQHLRNRLNIHSNDVRYHYKRFIEAKHDSYHANRFSFVYELHRAHKLKASDPRDRVFAFLGHFSKQSSGSAIAAMDADYSKTMEEVYVDVAVRSLHDATSFRSRSESGQFHFDPALIILSAVQHEHLPSSGEYRPLSGKGTKNSGSGIRLPSWVRDWRFNRSYILGEPIQPPRAQGGTTPKLKISEKDLTLNIHGFRLTTIETCSRGFKSKEFQQKAPSDVTISALPIQYVWHDICAKGTFSLEETYPNGDSAFFACMQTLSNGCIQNAGSHRGGLSYAETPSSIWLSHASDYIEKTVSHLETIGDDIPEIARNAQSEEGYLKWSRVADAATNGRAFAVTSSGHYVLGPLTMEPGDIICVFFGGKMPFCLRPWGDKFLLVGECYVHGYMNAEAIAMHEAGILEEETFVIV